MNQFACVRPDCRHYNGYKPCGFQETCLDCPHYQPAGKRILVIKLGAAGDVIRTTPILTPLRQREDPCHITWLTDPVSMDLLRQTKNIDQLLEWSWENCMALQARQFDLLLNFDKDAKATALADLIPAEQKMGFAPGPLGKTFIFNEESLYALQLGLSDELKYRVNQKSATQIVFEMIGLDYAGEEYEIALSDYAVQFSREIRDKYHISSVDCVVGLNTGCGDAFATKKWTLEGFAETASALRSANARVLLLGGPREKEFNAALMQILGDQAIDSGCDNTVEEFMGIVDACDLIVTADTMALHIAIGLKKRVVAIFGPTCHQEINLFGRGEKIVTDFPCSPCYLKTCDKNPTCMMALDSAKVVEATLRQMKALRSQNPLD